MLLCVTIRLLHFQMRTSALQSNNLTEIRDVIIQPLETYPVYVTYSPISPTLNSGKVVIKPYDTAYKFSVSALYSTYLYTYTCTFTRSLLEENKSAHVHVFNEIQKHVHVKFYEIVCILKYM